jgi:hypothetical protein
MDDSDCEVMGEDMTIRSVVVKIPGKGTDSTAYLLKLSLLKHYESDTARMIKAKLVVPGAKGKPDDLVGWLTGNLLERPDPRFYETADEISQEVQELSVIFCNFKGIANRIKHPSLKEYPDAVNEGGFLQIYMFEVRSDHQKKGLGLCMIHQMLIFLRDEWTLAVMVPGPLTFTHRKWQNANPHAAQEANIIKNVERLGFLQAGQRGRLKSYFFLTSDRWEQLTEQKLKQQQQQNKQKQKQRQKQSAAVSRKRIRYILREKGTTESGHAFERYKAVKIASASASASVSVSASASASASALSKEAQQQQEPQEKLVAVSVKEWAESLAHNSAVTAPELSAVLRRSPFAAFFMETKGVSADTAGSKAFEFVLVDAPQLLLPATAANKANLAAFQNQLESKKCAAQSIGCRFQNRLGDTVLVAPKPLVSLPLSSSPATTSTLTPSSLAAEGAAVAATNNNIKNSSNNNAQEVLLPYTHLANFVRQAPAHQVTDLWQVAASAYLEALHLDKNNNEEDSISSTGEKKKNKLTPNRKKRQKTSSGEAKPVWFSTSGMCMGVAWLFFRLDERPKYYTYRAFAEET